MSAGPRQLIVPRPHRRILPKQCSWPTLTFPVPQRSRANHTYCLLSTMLPLVSLCLALTSLVYAAAINDVRPLVVWHGLGDTFASPGMVQFESEVMKMHPGIFVHSVYIHQDAGADQRAGFVSDVSTKDALFTEGPSSMGMSINNSPLSLSNSPRFQSLAEGLMPSGFLKGASSCAHMWSEITHRPCTISLLSDHNTWASLTCHCAVPLICCVRSLAVPQRLGFIVNGHRSTWYRLDELMLHSIPHETQS